MQTTSSTIQKPKTTKEQIISLLSEEWPLTAKEIHDKLEKEFYTELSYQATHKMLTEMQENSLLSNINKKFELNPNWVKNQKQFFEKIEAKYSGDDKKYVIDQDTYEPQKFEFNDMSTF